MRVRVLRFSVLFFLILVFGGLRASAQGTNDLDAANEALLTGDYQKARRLYRPLIDTVTGDRREDITGYFETFIATGEYTEGRKEVAERLAKNPDDPYFLYMKGRFHVIAGEYDLAEDAYVRAWEKKEDFVRNILAVGELLEKTGRKREARSCYLLIVQEYKENKLKTARHVGIAAEALARGGDFHEANRVFRIAYDVDPRDTQVLFWWANLFGEKFNGADAQRTFEEALAINPNSAELLIGYARSFESLSRWEMLAIQALKVNPNSSDAMNILAQIAILDGNYDHAEEIVERALEINPVDEWSLANLSTVYFLRGDKDAFTQTERIMRSSNPRCGGFYVTIADNCIYRYRYADAVEFCLQAVSVESDNWHAYAILGTNILRLGRVDEARRYLERAFEGDPFDIFARNSLELLDDFSDFVTVESDHFTLLIHTSEHQVLAKPILDLAEECYDSLSVRYSYIPKGKIRLEAYNDHDDFAVRISGLPGIGLLGVCFGDVVAFDTPRAQGDDEYNWADTLWHEIAHVMAVGISDSRVPRWFTEGLSVYEEQRARPEWGRDMELELFTALDQGLLLSLDDINKGFTRPDYEEQVFITYYQSAQIIGYIVSKYGFGAIDELLAAFRNDDWKSAFPKVLGVSTESLNTAFIDALKEKRKLYNLVLDGAPPLLSVQQKKAGTEAGDTEKTKNPFFRALIDGNDLLGKGEWTEAERNFLEAVKIYPNYVSEGNPYVGLAAIYRREKNEKKLADILEQYLSITDYGAAEACELAELLEKSGNTQGAVHYYRRSLEVAPYELVTHTRLAELYQKQNRYQQEAAARRIVLTLNPMDRAKAYYFLALSLFNGNQISDAKREVMRSLELAPGYRDAQKLLLACVGE